MRYRIKTTNRELFLRAIELLREYRAEPKVALEKRCTISVDDLTEPAIKALRELPAAVTHETRYSPD